MRKYLILFVLLFSIGTFIQANAQTPCFCPGPYAQESITVPYSDGINTCLVTITYCNHHFKENTIGGIAVRAMTICSISFPAGCTLTVDLSSSGFWNDMMMLIIEHDAATLDPLYIPDCNDPDSYFTNFYYELTKAQCWILENDLIQQMFVFTPCEGETATCWKEFAVCYNTLGELVVQERQSQIIGTSNCSYEGSTILNPETFPFDECFDTCY